MPAPSIKNGLPWSPFSVCLFQADTSFTASVFTGKSKPKISLTVGNSFYRWKGDDLLVDPLIP